MSIVVVLSLVISVAINVWLLKRSPRSAKQTTHSTLMQGIKNVRELTTIRQSFQSIVMFKDAKSVPFLGFTVPGTTQKFILKYGGIVTCGNDLSDIQISERFAVNRLRIVVPRSRIFDLYADVKSVQLYDQKAGIFTSVSLEDQNREILQNLKEVREEVLQSDILRRADENTRMVLTTLAASMGMEAEVIFDDGKEDTRVSLSAETEEAAVSSVSSSPDAE